ncbi:MAG: hypothetical protein GQ538_00550 [Xanthomonadales bacterium]|nr:hypothetical protein [Xanthomonadales bacterium]
MQSAKAILLILMCLGLLGACGLKGPLYLPQDDVTKKPANQTPEAQAEDSEDKKKSEKDNLQVPVSIR